MNYLQRKKMAFMSVVNAVKGFVRTVSGILPLVLKGCVGNDSITDLKLYGESVQDGTPSPDAPIDILSVGEPTINLYEGKSEVTYSAVTNITNYSLYEALEIGKTYTLFCYIDNTLGVANAHFRLSVGRTGGTYDYNTANSVAAGATGYSVKAFTVPEDYTGFLNMQFSVPSGGTATFKDIMLVEGSYNRSNLPAYTKPYKIPLNVNDKVYDIYATKPLMKFGDYSDYIDFANKKIVRNIKRGCLNGGEGWSTSGTRYYYSISGLNIKCLGTGVKGIMSSALPSVPWNSIRNSGVGIATYIDNRIDVRADSVWSTVDELKAYLRHNPASYIAPMLNPEEEEIDIPLIETDKGTNIIDVDTIIKPSHVEITYYSTVKE